MTGKLELIPIKERAEDNEILVNIPLCRETVSQTIDFYKKVGFVPPWIGYCVMQNGDIVGSAGFKGPPVNGTIEIAYGTNEPYRRKGIGAAICKLLVDVSMMSDPSIKITARTLQVNNFSARILEKNNFVCAGIVNDPEDGEVFEWVYSK